MQSIKQIRQYYGLTQQDLADFLSVSKPMVAMAETQQRSLPTAALLLLNQLRPVPMPQPAPPVVQEVLVKQAAARASALARHVQKCTIGAVLARRKLMDLQKKQQHASHTLQLCHQLRQAAINKPQLTWVEMMEKIAAKKLLTCGELPQFLLQLKVKALEMQVNEATGVMNYGL
jgi:hypothetical protein